MADLIYRNQGTLYPAERTCWGAIWMGVFSFVAIWSVFGMLGEAIFASAANPNARAPVAGISIGMGIWAIVLTVIAMYVAGRVTAHFSDIGNRTSRIMHGMAMFGLSAVAAVLIIILGGSAFTGGAAVQGSAHSPYMLTVFADVGWTGFIALFLGWLAALGGAAQGSGTGGGTAAVQDQGGRDIRSVA